MHRERRGDRDAERERHSRRRHLQDNVTYYSYYEGEDEGEVGNDVGQTVGDRVHVDGDAACITTRADGGDLCEEYDFEQGCHVLTIVYDDGVVEQAAPSWTTLVEVCAPECGCSTAGVDFSVDFEFVANGDPADYDSAERSAILATLATEAGLSTAGATLSLTPASTAFAASFPVASATAATTAQATLATNIPDASALQTALSGGGITLTVLSSPTSTITRTGTSSPPPQGGDDSLPIPLIAAGGGGAVFFAVLFFFLFRRCQQKKPSAATSTTSTFPKPVTAESASVASSTTLPTVVGSAVASGAPPRPVSQNGGGMAFAGFVSHCKAECAMEARFLQTELEQKLGERVFIDSDDLRDLRELLEHVRRSKVLVCVLSPQFVHRPYCLLEMVTAIDAGIPLVAVAVAKRRNSTYDYAGSENFLMHLDKELDASSRALLQANGISSLEDVAWKLSSILPKIISIDFNPSASRNVLNGMVDDICEAMSKAHPLPLMERGAWQETRQTLDRDRAALDEEQAA